MPVAIRLTDVISGPFGTGVPFVRLRNPWPGNWLQTYDVDAHEGFGDALFGPEPELALWFDTIDDAKACWWQQSKVMPERDGRENRPLTVCSISIDAV